MSTNKKILLLSVIPSDFTKLLNLALLLRKHSFEVEFYFDQRSHSLEDSIRVAKKNDFYCHYKNRPLKKQVDNKQAGVSSFLKKIKSLVFLKRLKKEIQNVQTIRSTFIGILKRRDITVVIVPLSTCGYNLPVYLDACKKSEVKSVCLPFAIGGKEALEKAILFSPKSSSKYLYNQAFGIFFKKWKLYSKGQPYFVLPAEEIIAYNIMGVEVKYPTSFYGVHVNALMLENEYMKIHALKQSVSADHITVTGSIFDDELYKIKNNRDFFYEKLCHQYSLDEKKELILIALPPLVKKEASDMRFFDALVLLKKFVPDSIDLSQYNVLVSLHPRIQHHYSDCADTNIRLSNEAVERLIPLCNLFISTFSSTIRTAVSLNIPVINYDIVKFNYQLFNDFPQVKKVQSEEEYLNALADWINQTTSNRSVPEENLLGSTLDGYSKNRILKAIVELLVDNH